MISQNFSLRTVAFVAMVILAGCQAPSTGSNTSTPNGERAIKVEYSAADQAAYDGAIQLKDTKYCEKISNQAYKKQCKDTLNDEAKLQEALVKVDATICVQLSSKDQQDACKIAVEVKLQKAADQKKQEAERAKDLQLESSVIQSGDFKRCKELKVEGNFNDCEVNILTTKAIQTKDNSWCDKASNDQNKQSCKAVATKMTGK